MQKTKSKLAPAVKILNKLKGYGSYLHLALVNDEVQFVRSTYKGKYSFSLILKDKFETSSEVYVDLKGLTDFFKFVKSKDILNFKAVENGVEISNGVITKKYQLPDTRCEAVKLHEYSQKLTVNTKEFLHGLNATVPFTDTNNPKTEINTLVFDTSTSGFKLVATDTRTIVTIDISSTPKLETQKLIMIPHTKALLELVKNCKDATISLEFSETNVKVETSEFIAQFACEEGNYPNYKKIIPDEGSENYPKFSELPADELLAMLSPYRRHKEGFICLKSTRSKIEVFLCEDNPDKGPKYISHLLGAINIANNNENQVGLRKDSLLVCLETLKDTNKKALAQFRSEMPAFVKAEGYLYMCMPLIM